MTLDGEMMTRQTLLLMLLMSASVGCAVDQTASKPKADAISWGNPQKRLQYGISMSKTEYIHEQPVTVIVHVKNVSNQEQTIRFPYHHVSEFVLTNAKGEVLKPRFECLKKHVSRDRYTPQKRFVLKPGETRSYTNDLLHLGGCSLRYSLTPGTYKVRHQLSESGEFNIVKKKATSNKTNPPDQK
jgi:hypothetical protein